MSLLDFLLRFFPGGQRRLAVRRTERDHVDEVKLRRKAERTEKRELRAEKRERRGVRRVMRKLSKVRSLVVAAAKSPSKAKKAAAEIGDVLAGVEGLIARLRDEALLEGEEQRELDQEQALERKAERDEQVEERSNPALRDVVASELRDEEEGLREDQGLKRQEQVKLRLQQLEYRVLRGNDALLKELVTVLQDGAAHPEKLGNQDLQRAITQRIDGFERKLAEIEGDVQREFKLTKKELAVLKREEKEELDALEADEQGNAVESDAEEEAAELRAA